MTSERTESGQVHWSKLSFQEVTGKAKKDDSGLYFCPLSDERTGSLHIAEGDKQSFVMTCHRGGCSGSTKDHLEALGFDVANTIRKKRTGSDVASESNNDHVYVWKCARTGKTFKQYRKDAADGFSKDVRYELGAKTANLLYVNGASAPPSHSRIIVEGARTADVLHKATGLPVIALPSSSSWKEWVESETTTMFLGMDVVFWPDFDKGGYELARRFLGFISSIAGKCGVVEPSRIPGFDPRQSGWDAADAKDLKPDAIVKAIVPASDFDFDKFSRFRRPKLGSIVNDIRMADYYLAECGEDRMFNESTGSWMRFNEDGWKSDTGASKVRREIQDMGESVYGPSKDGKFEPNVVIGGSSALAQRAESSARGVPSILTNMEEWDNGSDNDHLLMTPSGMVIDLKKGTQPPRKVRKSDRILMRTACEFQEDVKAYAEGEWLKFLNSAVDNMLISWLQRFVGYSITGLTKEQILLLIYGDSNTGKGTFMSSIMSAIGDYGRPIDSKDLMKSKGDKHPAFLADLVGVRVVWSDDPDGTDKWDVGMVKSLVTGDETRARFMRGNFFKMYPKFTVYMTAQHPPDIQAMDTGMQRRLRVFPFDNKIEHGKEDVSLREKIHLPDVLRWCAQGAEDYFREGLGDTPKVVVENTDSYTKSDDPVLEFLEYVSEEFENPQKRTPIRKSVFYQQFENWCKDNGWTHIIGKKRFNKTLRDNFRIVCKQVGRAKIDHWFVWEWWQDWNKD